jgi:hypothetical protein
MRDRSANISVAKHRCHVSARSPLRSLHRKLLTGRAISADLFLEWGFSREESQRAVAVMSDAAEGLSRHFHSKVQLYLRHYGMLMLQEVDNFFSFSGLDNTQVRRAMTYWLQNVANMPVPLQDSTIKEYANRVGIGPDDLVAAADELDINVAVVDDAVHAYVMKILMSEDASGSASIGRTKDEPAT